MALVRVLAFSACALMLAHPVLAASCDLEAEMAAIGKKVDTTDGPSKASDAWFDAYTPQVSAVMKAASEGDTETACEKINELAEWVDRNPPQ